MSFSNIKNITFVIFISFIFSSCQTKLNIIIYQKMLIIQINILKPQFLILIKNMIVD